MCPPTEVEAKLKIAILGAGSIGCFVGGCWQAAGLDVSFIGRTSFANEIAEHGLTLSDYSGWKVTLPTGRVDYRTNGQALADVVIIAL